MQPRKKFITAPQSTANNYSPFSFNDPDFFFKIKLLGDSGVGKSCLLLRYVEDTYTESYISTLGVDFKQAVVQVDSKTIKLQIWDTASQERFRSHFSQYERGLNGAILVFDLTDLVSFKNINPWIDKFHRQTGEDKNIILVGSKADLTSKRIISQAEIEALVNENPYIDAYIETSAKNNTNVDEAFKTAAQLIMNRRVNESNRLMSEQLVKKVRDYIAKNSFEVSGIMPGIISGEVIVLENGNKKVVPHFVKKHWEQTNLAASNSD